jgi:hypothetical protein
MPKLSFWKLLAAVTSVWSVITPGYAQVFSERGRKADIGFIEIDKDITLRRSVVRHASTSFP